MKAVTVINHLVIKAGMMDEFIDAQRKFASALPPCGLVGGRMYRSLDGRSAVLVSIFASQTQQEELAQRADFKEHLRTLQPFVDSSIPGLYEEAYAVGEVR